LERLSIEGRKKPGAEYILSPPLGAVKEESLKEGLVPVLLSPRITPNIEFLT
jgi:hypothetical protein